MHHGRSLRKGAFVISLFAAPCWTQAGQASFQSRRPVVDPIQVGERHDFEITYMGLPAVKFTFDVLPPETINDRKAYRVRGTAESLKLFSLIYRVDDSVETLFDHEGLFSHKFHLVQNESKQTRDSLEQHDPKKGESFYWDRWQPKGRELQEIKKTAPLPPYAQDYLSAVYYLRTVPLPDGAVVEFPVITEGSRMDIVATVEKREKLSTAIGYIPSVVVRVEKKNDQGKIEHADNFMWMSDDLRRTILKIEAKVKIGYVKAVLKDFTPGASPAPVSASATAVRAQ